jgi:tetratricopeptide (TPR) repeat protein
MTHVPSLLVGVGSLLVAMLAQGADPAAQACRAPDALLKAGYVDEAKAAYVTLLQSDTKPACADDGLMKAHATAVAQSMTRCAAADALLAADLVDDAKAAYVKLLSDDATTRLGCAHAGLAKVHATQASKGKDVIAGARALAGYGLHDEARAAIQTQLKSDGAMEIPPDLQYLSGGKVPLWRSIRRDLEPWARPVLEMAAAVLLLIVLLGLLARRFAKRTLTIEAFDSGSVEDAHLGADFAAIVRSHLNRMVQGSHGGHIELVTGPIQTIDIPAEVEAAVPTASASWMSPLTWVRAIPALLNWLSPSRTVSLTGRLHKPGRRGPGITVQLVEGGRIFGSYTFWQYDFDAPSDPAPSGPGDGFQPLAEYVAIWLVFQLAKAFRSGIELLGTDDWRSYSYFRAGYMAEMQGRDEASKGLYIRALDRDAEFRGARVNLAAWFLRHRHWQQALEHLLRARDDCLAADHADRDPTLYSTIYNLAALKYELHDVREAKALTVDLLVRIDRTLARIHAKKKGYGDPTLKRHLDIFRPVANVMLAGLLAELGEEGGVAIIQAEANVSSVILRLQYNLGCGYAILAQHEPQDMPEGAVRRTHSLGESLKHLECAFQIDANTVAQAQGDRCFDFLRVTEAAKYQALIDAYGPQPPQAPAAAPELALAKLDVIGEQHAKALAVENIRAPHELLLRTLDPGSRRVLAAKLGITEQVVTLWAHAADLLRIVGLQPQHLTLLSRAGLHRLSELEIQNPAPLKALLDDLSAADGAIDPPDIAAVNAWVSDARTNTRPKVL